jgi:hypothetical protein
MTQKHDVTRPQDSARHTVQRHSTRRHTIAAHCRGHSPAGSTLRSRAHRARAECMLDGLSSACEDKDGSLIAATVFAATQSMSPTSTRRGYGSMSSTSSRRGLHARPPLATHESLWHEPTHRINLAFTRRGYGSMSSSLVSHVSLTLRTEHTTCRARQRTERHATRGTARPAFS